MATVTAYWRPRSLGDAFELLERPGAVVLAGGTTLNATAGAEPVEVVDVQALGLDGIAPGPGGTLVIGATATLQALADAEQAPAVVREAARRELPSTLRAQATVGGRVATGDRESELLAALLVHDAVVRIRWRNGTEEHLLAAVLAGLPLPPGRLVESVTVATGGHAAAARTGRTPADRPIVAAYARSADGGVRTALTGVAATPVLVEEAAGLDPPGDFRGSAAYRRALAEVLLARVREALR